MNNKISVLMLEDEAADASLVTFALREGGLEVVIKRVETKAEFLQALEQPRPDLILSDFALPSFDGFEALQLAKAKMVEVPFIFVTGTLGEELAIETLKSGATDYVLKTRLSRLVPAVHRALREAEERNERRRAEDRLRESHEQLRALSRKLQSVREEERTRISREVHDELGQMLTSMKLDLSQIASRLPKQSRNLADRVKTLTTHVDSTIQTVRRISTELRPGVLDDLGLMAAIEWQAHEFQRRTGIECIVTLNMQETVGNHTHNHGFNTAFFRIFQETLTNIIRHAQATRVEVSLAEGDDQVQLEVRDNGRGISAVELTNTKSLGLLGMRERAALLGGQVTISGTEGKGTVVRVSIPNRQPDLPQQQRNGNHENTDHRRSRGGAPWFETNPR